MTSVLTRVALVIAFAVAAGWQVSARTLTITFKTAAPSSSVECVASMTSTDKIAKRVRLNEQLTWNLDGHLCTGFDPKNVTLIFESKVMKNSGPFTGSAGTGGNGVISQPVTNSATDAPASSQHIYIIKYNMKNAGDPEIDINNNPTPGGGSGRGRRGGRE